MIQRRYRTPTLLAALLVVLACAPALPSAPASETLPTFDPNSLQTAIVQTAAAAATQTAFMASPTPTPTSSPPPPHTPTETATPTFLFLLPTLTFTITPVTIVPSNAEFACQIVSQTPSNDSRVNRNETFDVTWRVVNVGTRNWDRGSTDFLYVSGARMHLQPLYDFEVSVAKLASVELTVSMQAPSEPGNYTTTWRIRYGNTTFCPMTLDIIVN